jgi:arabinose-5-phosphate isomerase
MEARGFSSEAFAAYHPGGALGKRLYTRLGDLLDARRIPAVAPDAPFHDVLLSITSGRMGATAVLTDGRIAGIVTDGDIRRALERSALGTAAQMMGKSPEVMEADELAVEAFHRMETRSISQVIVTRAGAYAGMVHLHDLLREGIF